jgi:hypothetical protein
LAISDLGIRTAGIAEYIGTVAVDHGPLVIGVLMVSCRPTEGSLS